MPSKDLVWVALKLARAVKHLESVNEQFRRLIESEDCGIVSDFKSEPGYLVIKAYMRGEPSPLCSLDIGEALYQLRSALDHVVCYLTERNGNVVDEKTEFPIFDRRDKFLDQSGGLMPGILKRIGGLTPQQRAIIEAEQPFQGKYGAPQDDPLWSLYRLADFDRHQFLHLVGVVTLYGHEVFTPQWFADRYFTQIASTYGAFEGETELARFKIDPAANDVTPKVAVKVHSNVTFGIAFDQKGPGAGTPVMSTMKAIGERVANLVNKF